MTANRLSSPFAGVAVMVVAMAVLPGMDALSKLLSQTYPSEQIIWVRTTVHALIILPIALLMRVPVLRRPHLAHLHLIRALAFTAMSVTYVAGLRWVPLADAMGIVFLFPMLVTALSAVFLGEAVGRVRWAAVAAGFGGVVLIVQPGGREAADGVGLGMVLIFIAALSTAVYVILTRKLAASTPSLALLWFPAAVGALVLATAIPFSWVPPDGTDLMLMGAVGVLSAFVHLLIIIAYRLAEASLIAPLAYLQIVGGVILGFVMFADIPTAATWAGLGVVIASGIVVTVREHHRRRRMALDAVHNPIADPAKEGGP